MFSRCRSLIQGLSRRPRAVVAGLTLLTLLAVGGWLGGRRLWADYHYRAARESLERGDFAAAQVHLAVCLAVWPQDAPTHLLAARCARRTGRYDEAEEHLRHSRGPGTSAADVTLEKAMLSVQRGHLRDAEDYLKRTVTPDHPDAVLALEALAVGYAKTDRLASLLECTDLWLQLRPDNAPALRWRGYAWERSGDSAKALDCYQRAVVADPNDDDARLSLGRLLVERFARPREALEQFERLRQHRPDDPAVLLGLARSYFGLARLDEARQTLNALLARHSRTPEALALRGKLALETESPRTAEKWLRDAVSLAADDREALDNLVRCLHQLGRDDEAATYRARVEKLRADLARLDALLPAIGKSPNDPALRREAGLICLRYRKDREALHWLNSALEASPGDRPTHAALAEYYRRQGKPEQAEAHRRRAEGSGE